MMSNTKNVFKTFNNILISNIPMRPNSGRKQKSFNYNYGPSTPLEMYMYIYEWARTSSTNFLSTGVYV